VKVKGVAAFTVEAKGTPTIFDKSRVIEDQLRELLEAAEPARCTGCQVDQQTMVVPGVVSPRQADGVLTLDLCTEMQMLGAERTNFASQSQGTGFSRQAHKDIRAPGQSAGDQSCHCLAAGFRPATELIKVNSCHRRVRRPPDIDILPAGRQVDR